MRKTLLLPLWFVVLVGSVHCQVSEKEKFIVRVLKVARVGNGCTTEVESDKVRYKLSSHVSGPCTMLRAGELYKAYDVYSRSADDLKDNSKDTPELVIENNHENEERPNAIFDIDSQEAR